MGYADGPIDSAVGGDEWKMGWEGHWRIPVNWMERVRAADNSPTPGTTFLLASQNGDVLNANNGRWMAFIKFRDFQWN